MTGGALGPGPSGDSGPSRSAVQSSGARRAQCTSPSCAPWEQPAVYAVELSLRAWWSWEGWAGVCPGPNIPLQGRQGSRGCIPCSPGESGLVSRGSQGLRSPLESRLGSLGAP